MNSHRGYLQMSFCPRTPKFGVSKFLKLCFLAFWKAIISFENLWLRWGLKQSCSLHWDFSNNMWHVTCTHVFQSNSWVLVGRNQNCTLIPHYSFKHNLCFKYSNEQNHLNIHVSRNFQWYKEHFNLVNFDP